MSPTCHPHLYQKNDPVSNPPSQPDGGALHVQSTGHWSDRCSPLPNGVKQTAGRPAAASCRTVLVDKLLQQAGKQRAWSRRPSASCSRWRMMRRCFPQRNQHIAGLRPRVDRAGAVLVIFLKPANWRYQLAQ